MGTRYILGKNNIFAFQHGAGTPDLESDFGLEQLTGDLVSSVGYFKIIPQTSKPHLTSVNMISSL